MDSTEIQSQPAAQGITSPDGVWSRPALGLAAALLALLTLALYWPATHHAFVNYDDTAYVLDNLHVTTGLNWDNLKWACSHPVSANWHPLTMFSHMLDCQLFGLQPMGHHLTSVLLHAVNAALVFLLLCGVTGAPGRSLSVAALFALHPLRVESVAWVSERKDVLSGCFGLLTLLCYARYVGQLKIQNPKSKTFYALSLAFFACGLMSKPMLVTWPCVMLLLDWWPLGRWQRGVARRLLSEKFPFFALAAAAGAVTFFVQKNSGAVQAIGILPGGARIGNALISYCRYLEKLFWPTDLAVFYPYPENWSPGQVALAGLLLGGISALVWAQRRRHPFLLMGWLWYLGTMVPVIGLVQVGLQSMADRYTYLPSLGVLIMVVWGGYEAARRSHRLAVGFSLAGVTVIICCLILTRQQLEYWQDSESLFRHASAVTKNNFIAYNNLALFLNEKGKSEEAIGQFQKAIRAKPDFAEACNNLGYALYLKGRSDEAIPQYQAALHLKPDYAEGHCNLGITLFQKGRAEEAMGQFQEALRLKPDYADAHYNLALALVQKGRIDEALPKFQEVLRLKPGDAEARYNFALALDEQGRTNDAIAQYQTTLRLKPDNAGAGNNLGLLLAARGENLDLARALIQKAVELEPKNTAFLDSLGWVLSKQNRLREALDYQQRAIANATQPDPTLYDHLGDIYAALKQNGLADGAWRKSLSLAPSPQIQKKLDELSAH